MTMRTPFFLLIICGLWAIHAAAESSEFPPEADAAKTDASILSEPPEKPDPSARYLFYLHGRIVQEKGRGAVSPKFGPYEYDEILEEFAAEGFVVISEVRPKGMRGSKYVDRVVVQVEGLLKSGVPAKRLTIVGASAGGYIAMTVSSRVSDPNVGYVVMGSCNKRTIRNGNRLHGDLLSVYEASDTVGTSCAPMFSRAKDLSGHQEIRLDTGLEHGFLFRPLPEWMGPVTQWARDRDA